MAADERALAESNRLGKQLEERLPGWRKHVTDNAALTEWLGTQPGYIQRAADRNLEGITDVDEAADVISRFLADAGIDLGSNRESGAKPVTQQQKPRRPLSAQRRLQLASSAGVRDRKTPRPDVANGEVGSEDPVAIWNEYARQGL